MILLFKPTEEHSKKHQDKTIMREICYNCRADVYSTTRYGLNYYKYCPKCGVENNSSLKTKYKNKFFSIDVLFIMIFAIFAGLFLCANYGRTGNMFAFMPHQITYLVAGVIMYLIIRLLYKTCLCCGNWGCKRSHQYCYNCGKPLNLCD